MSNNLLKMSPKLNTFHDKHIPTIRSLNNKHYQKQHEEMFLHTNEQDEMYGVNSNDTNNEDDTEHCLLPQQQQQQQQQQCSPKVVLVVADKNESVPSMSQRAKRKIPLGFIFVVISAFFFSIMSLAVAITTQDYNIPSYTVLLIRCIWQSVGGFIACYFSGSRFPSDRTDRFWLAVRGFLGVGSMGLLYLATSMISLADATSLFFTTPIFTGIMARLMLKEPYSIWDGFAVILCVIGCLLVVRPPGLFGNLTGTAEIVGSVQVSPHSKLIGSMAAITGAILSACVYISIRKLGNRVHTSTLVAATGYCGILEAIVGMLFQSSSAKPIAQWSFVSWLWLNAVGAFALIAQGFFNRGVQLENAASASLARNTDILFVFIWQLTIQHQPPSTLSVIGAVVISVAVLATVARKLYISSRVPAAQLLPSVSSEEVELEKLPTVST